MGLVVITIPGADKADFVNKLQSTTNGQVDLVVVQRIPTLSLWQCAVRFLQRTPPRAWLKEIWFAGLLRSRPLVRQALGYFLPTNPKTPAAFNPPTLYTADINSLEVLAAIQAQAPSLVVVWGSTMLTPATLASLPPAINLHFGLCPFYRGAVANQLAVLRDDYEHLGVTVHFINEKPDAGAVIATITTDPTLPPPAMFHDLHQQATEYFLATAVNYLAGQQLPTMPQDQTIGVSLRLRDWRPSVRYAVGSKLLARTKAMESSLGQDPLLKQPELS